MNNGSNDPSISSVFDTHIELRDLERRLRAHTDNGSRDVLVLLVCIFVIVVSAAGLPLGILGVIVMARQSSTRRKLLKQAAELDRSLAAKLND